MSLINDVVNDCISETHGLLSDPSGLLNRLPLRSYRFEMTQRPTHLRWLRHRNSIISPCWLGQGVRYFFISPDWDIVMMITISWNEQINTFSIFKCKHLNVDIFNIIVVGIACFPNIICVHCSLAHWLVDLWTFTLRSPLF